MNSFTGVILFIFLAAASLAIVSFANRAQTRNRVIRVKTQQLRRRIAELEDMCVAIEPMIETTQVPTLISEEIIDLMNSVKKLDPNARDVDDNLKAVRDRLKKYQTGNRQHSLYRLLTSDAAIARAKYQLNEAGRIVRRHANVGRLNAEEMEEYVEELAWAHLMVDAITHIGHGHRAVSRAEYMNAYNHYRSAQKVLLKSNHSDSRRHRMAREVGEILNNERTCLSTDLMPETEFNPSENGRKLPIQKNGH